MLKQHRDSLILALNDATGRTWEDHSTSIVASPRGKNPLYLTRDDDGATYFCDADGKRISSLGAFKYKNWTLKLAEAVKLHLKPKPAAKKTSEKKAGKP